MDLSTPGTRAKGVSVRSQYYQQVGTPSGFVAGIPVGRAAVPVKMPQVWPAEMETVPDHPVVDATSVRFVFPFDGVKFILPTPVPVSAIKA